jgi:hypothetical protein
VRAPLDLSKQKTPGFLIIHTNGIRVLFLGMRELSERERERERFCHTKNNAKITLLSPFSFRFVTKFFSKARFCGVETTSDHTTQ